MMCIGNCAVCPYYKMHRKRNVHPVQVSVPEEPDVVEVVEETTEEPEMTMEVVPAEVVPTYAVKRTITGKLKGVLQG